MAQGEGLESRGKKIILINREIFAFSGQQSQHRLECWLLISNSRVILDNSLAEGL